MTLPIHPLRGVPLRLVQIRNGPGREPMVLIEHPPGETMWLPVRWTDRGQPASGSSSARATARALLQVARTTRALIDDGGFLDSPGEEGAPCVAERIISGDLGSGSGRAALDGHRVGPAKGADRHVGDAGQPGQARCHARGRARRSRR